MASRTFLFKDFGFFHDPQMDKFGSQATKNVVSSPTQLVNERLVEQEILHDPSLKTIQGHAETLRSSESSRSKSKVDAGRSCSVLVAFNFYSLVLTGINQIQFRYRKVYTCSNHNLFLHRLVNHWLLACRKLFFISLIQP